MRWVSPENFRLTEQSAGGMIWMAAGGERLSVHVLDHDLIRVCLRPDGAPRLSRTWLVSGDGGDVPHEGRLRDDTARFPCPPHEQAQDGATFTLATRTLHLTITTGGDLRLTWATAAGAIFAQDVPRRAYLHDLHSGAVRHTLARRAQEHYYGCGEVSGELDKAESRVRLFPKDAIGYNARHSAPLYKHFPFTLTYVPEHDIAYGLLYDNTAETVFDFGQEINAALTPHRYYQAATGDLDYYLIYGASIEGVLEKLALLTGYPALLPRYTLGYMASTMLYTELPDTQAQLLGFIEQCRHNDIPCDVFHLSSGYTTDATGARQVFTWNAGKVPDPDRLTDAFRAAGIRLCANIKPHLLTTHPQYAEVAGLGGFVRDPDAPESPLLNLCWKGGLEEFADGAFVDFTHPAGYGWWKARCEDALLSRGIEALWNDNNEFEIYNDDARTHATTAAQARPLLTLLMARASYEAIRQHDPDRRPFVLTRSATVGVQRYAQTWSGDNRMGWDTLRYNLPMGLNLSLSGLPHVGHDVGGFVGGRPSPELFVRWVQCNSFHPRFTIHSLAHDGEPNSPWMYPEVLPLVRDAIRQRYRLIPYLYSLLFEASSTGHPVIRPLVYHYPHDPHCRTESFDFMLGASLLVAPVLDEGARERAVYLPAGAPWHDFYTGEAFAGGATARVPAPLERIPLFVPSGALLPLATLGDVLRHTGDIDGGREALVYPQAGAGIRQATLIEDDGVSMAYIEGGFSVVTLACETSTDGVAFSAWWQGGYDLPYTHVDFRVPPTETRPLHGGEGVQTAPDGWRVVRVPVSRAL